MVNRVYNNNSAHAYDQFKKFVVGFGTGAVHSQVSPEGRLIRDLANSTLGFSGVDGIYRRYRLGKSLYDYGHDSGFIDPELTKQTGDAMSKALYGDDSTSGDGAGSGYGGSSPFTYSDWSPAAKMFGMDRSTAYEEHLANTAHQREVADLKAAGLNPVLGLSSGAPVVSGSYAGGFGYGSTAKKVSFKNIADVIGSVAGLIVLSKTKNKYAGSWAASMTSKAFSQAGKLLDDVFE